MNIGEIYTNQVWDNLKPLLANWEPTKPIKLGDFGVLRDRIFIPMGNIKDLNIQFAAEAGIAGDHKFFASSDSTQIKFTAQGAVPISGITAKASLEVDFSSSDAAFFNAADCSYSTIADKVALANAIMGKYDPGPWKREWAVVTDLVTSGSTTIAVSAGRAASIVFEASGNVPQIDLADAKIGLTVKSATNVGYQIVAQNGLTPLIGLCTIQPTFLWFGSQFGPVVKAMANPQVLRALQTSELVKTEPSKASLYFGQVR